MAQSSRTPHTSLPRASYGSRLWTLCSRMGQSVFRGPGVCHSVLFGVTAGIASYGLYYVYRGVRLYFFDTETIALQSRKRYFEKQQLYQEELGRELAAGYIAHFVPQYDPVATRLPFQSL
ncbi:hypothetical protein IE077_000661 [Cardiosporidium cionae]|uniref:Transmembrane protein n=1 Tax=Cardiosporidium cionae TaxID=476202 RepID=A0ABQ7J6Y4_9APIC|nr:hypothetical protein IE077_000661 [Cardiosporidium cionae]|eukprot:KAF8819742.1 hypothetical protein IE077_000661 [Cardiosporidium cionae]